MLTTALHTTTHNNRLWHLLRLEADQTFDDTWIDDHPCYGHNPGDIQPFHNLFLGDDNSEELGNDLNTQVRLYVRVCVCAQVAALFDRVSWYDVYMSGRVY